MNRSIVFKVVLGVVLVGAILAIAALAFNAGVNQGLMISTQVAADELPEQPLPAYTLPYWRPYYGFGHYGFLGCLLPLLLTFLVFWVLRALFWHGTWGGHAMHPGMWGMHTKYGKWEPGKDAPPFFVDWHRQAHEGKSEADPE